MKKLLVLITVMVAVFGFSTGAFAAWGDKICTDCKGCVVEHIPCTIATGQGVKPYCDDFEYDDFPFKPDRDGYCEDYIEDECPVIFNICNCKDPSIFDVYAVIGIRMTVLVDGVAGQLGAYWADPGINKIDMYTYGINDGDPCDTLGNLETFGTIDYWQSDRITHATPLNGLQPCDPIKAKNQAVVLFSETPTTGYLIDGTDVAEKRHQWWIDIPGMRIDRNVLHDGELISVKVELLAAGSGGICADCDAVCECIVDVAVVCCDIIPLPERFGMYFPYVTDGGDWNTGIVVTNIGSMLPWAEATVAPADMEATLILTDVNGDQYTYTKDDFTTSNWAFDLGTLLPEFSGTPADGPMWLEVRTNFLVDGYSYIENGIYGLGTQPRQWCSLLQIYEQYADLYGLPMGP